ncbi:MAG: hypothetical protein ABIJ56_02680 [Pseudomonadota bacterium]
MSRRRLRILFKGAGDFASGGIRRLHLAGCEVVCTELAKPLNVRRKVSFAEAVWEGETEVEGVRAARCDISEIDAVLEQGAVPVVVDPDLEILGKRDFDVFVDATMAKKNSGTRMGMAPVVVALGPGFRAGLDCHAVVETLAGHDMGRVIYDGEAAPDTGVPGPAELYLFRPGTGDVPDLKQGSAAFDWNVAVLRAPCDGTFTGRCSIGDIVDKDQVVGEVDGEPVRAGLRGVVRGSYTRRRGRDRGAQAGRRGPGLRAFARVQHQREGQRHRRRRHGSGFCVDEVRGKSATTEQTMAVKKSPRAGEVRCLNCFERINPHKGAERFACPSCSMEWRISWISSGLPKIRGPVWDKVQHKPLDKQES